MNTTTSLLDRLSTATHAQRLHSEGLPFASAVARGSLPQESYIEFLRAMLIVYEAFEHALARAPHPIAAVWLPEPGSAALLRDDLAAFAQHPAHVAEVTLRAQVIAWGIEHRALDNPISLLGDLYALEGSLHQNGLLRTLALPYESTPTTQGCSFLARSEGPIGVAWDECSQRMGALASGDTDQARVIAAARETLTGIGMLLAALHPLSDRPLQELASVLNPAAGNHPIPNTMHEISAAIRAGDRVWREFPYFEQRYATRGRQFTWSDSAWLVTISAFPQSEVDHQVAWLGSMLAARGMPRLLLEQHLEVLYEELIATLPNKAPVYASLHQAARRLHEQRHAQIDAEHARRLAAAFDAAVDPALVAQLPHTGQLLVAAVADECAGLTQVVSSLAAWLTDPARFPPQWIAAVQDTIAQARHPRTP